MATANIFKSLGMQVVKFLMNTSDAPTNHHSLSEENAQMPDQFTQDNRICVEKIGLADEASRYHQPHTELLERYAKLRKEFERRKIYCFEDLAQYDELTSVFIELARLTPPVSMEGNNIGLFGLTSTGKSTMVNNLLDLKADEAAEVGHGGTTVAITPYHGPKRTLWDMPGWQDEPSYFSMEYVSFFKGLSKRLILIHASVKENSGFMEVLDELDLPYDIVFNKFDTIEEEEQQVQIRSQIRSEVQQLGLKRVNNIYFLSARNPRMFDDWIKMIHYLCD